MDSSSFFIQMFLLIYSCSNPHLDRTTESETGETSSGETITTHESSPTPTSNNPLQNLKVTIVTGICVLFVIIFIGVILAYCVRRAVKSRARRNLENDIYMDFKDTGLNQDRFVASTYQDLNAPPKLPERRLTRLSKGSTIIEPCQNQRFYTDEQILAQQTRIGDNTHDYMDMTSMNKAASTNKDAHIYAYSLRFGNKETDTLPQD